MKAETIYIPAPMARPILAVIQIPAAVVRPLILPPTLIITPAHRKEIPLTAWAATLAESAPLVPKASITPLLPMSANPYLEISMIKAAVQQTITCVRTPASLKCRLRSRPTMPPTRKAKISRRQNSAYCNNVNFSK